MQKQEKIRKLLHAPYTRYEGEPISRAVALALYGRHPYGSITRLERFAACAYAHFLQYGLKLAERETSAFESVDMGNIYHTALSHDVTMRLEGRIDRLDTFEDENKISIKVIDYKSGNTKFDLIRVYRGLQLQLVVYMDAAMEMLRGQHPKKEILPGGILYYHIDDPVLESDTPLSDEEAEQALLFALRSKVASTEEFAVITRYVEHEIRQCGEAIYAGNIAVNPYRSDIETSCTYCPYGSVCGMDAKIPGYEYRQFASMKKEEVLDQMQTELARNRGKEERSDGMDEGTAERH